MKKSDIDPMPEYFDRYINLSDDIELSDAFDQSLRQLDALDPQLLATLDGRTYAPGKWTVAEVLQHIIDWERILGMRTLLFARGDATLQPSIDEALLGEHMKAEHRRAGELVEELRIVRLSTKAMFASFDDETLGATGMNWKYEMSVLAMGFNIIGHQLHHLKIVEEKYYPLAGRSR